VGLADLASNLAGDDGFREGSTHPTGGCLMRIKHFFCAAASLLKIVTSFATGA
jgi:hypothetical protein